jgi:tartrate dehydratase alpha subunit/fumarate hydratase class I-like protein
MSKSNALENAILELIFKATTFADIAENDTTSPATNLYVSLHTADPDETGTQASNETSYGSYARVAVARSGAGWTVTGNTVTNAGLVQFPQCSSGTPTITHVGVGIGPTAASATVLLYKGALSSPLAVSSGIQPQFAIGALSIAED